MRTTKDIHAPERTRLHDLSDDDLIAVARSHREPTARRLAALDLAASFGMPEAWEIVQGLIARDNDDPRLRNGLVLVAERYVRSVQKRNPAWSGFFENVLSMAADWDDDALASAGRGLLMLKPDRTVEITERLLGLTDTDGLRISALANFPAFFFACGPQQRPRVPPTLAAILRHLANVYCDPHVFSGGDGYNTAVGNSAFVAVAALEDGSNLDALGNWSSALPHWVRPQLALMLHEARSRSFSSSGAEGNSAASAYWQAVLHKVAGRA